MAAPTVALSYASVVCRDIVGTSAFYRRVLGLEEVVGLASEHFRALRVGETILGFSAPAAFGLLGLPASDLDATPPTFWTFEVDAEAAVDRLVTDAQEAGGSCLRPPYRTYYGAWQAVLLDPEANAFRVNRSA